MSWVLPSYLILFAQAPPSWDSWIEIELVTRVRGEFDLKRNLFGANVGPGFYIPNEIHALCIDINPAEEVMGDGEGRPKASDGPTRSEKVLAW
jgi:hypothetical protein